MLKISFFGLLGLIFIVLKLASVISWSWWLVLAPLYVPFIVVIILVLIGFAIAAYQLR